MVIRTVIHINKNSVGAEAQIQALLTVNAMVRKGGFEPPRLSAPPPQDGVSASSTTSAKINDLQALFNIYTLPDGRTSSGSECCVVSIYGQRECCGMTDACRSSRNNDCV